MEAETDKTGGLHIGKVIGFSETMNKIRISFDTEEEGTYYIEDMLFDAANIVWKETPALEQRYV